MGISSIWWMDLEASVMGHPSEHSGLSPIVVGNSAIETVPKQTLELFKGKHEDRFRGDEVLREVVAVFRKSGTSDVDDGSKCSGSLLIEGFCWEHS